VRVLPDCGEESVVIPAPVHVPADQWQWQPAQAPPQPAGALHGELTEDGREIILLATGNAVARNQVALRLSKITALCTEAKHDGQPTGAVTVPATWGNAVQLGHSFPEGSGLAWVPHERLAGWLAEEVARRYSEPPELESRWPAWARLRDYQVQAARKIAHTGYHLLLDDPGLGKTVTTLAGIEQRRQMGTDVFPMVILVPTWDVADVWEREIAAWCPPEWGTPDRYEGTNRARLLRHPGVKILITTYATARRDAALVTGPLAKFAAATVVIDEGHLIKNVNAKQSHAARNIARHATTIVILSGTLITRNMGDAYAPLNAGDPGTWHDKKRFVQRFCWTNYDPNAAEGEIAGLNPYTAAEFRSCLLGQMTRRAKADVLPELPPKIYSVRRPEIPPEWRKAYRQMARDMLAALPGNDEELSVMDTLAQLTRLSQLASSAADVHWEDVYDEKLGEWVKKQVVVLRPPSWKAESAMEILAERRGDPVVIFSVSEQLARITGEHYLRPAGLRFGYVTGLRKGVTRTTRNRDIAAFQAGELDAIICTSAAGGLGITLSRGGTEIALQRPWPLDQSIQQEDRLQRLGAELYHDHIDIIDIVAKGTVDERVRELLSVKAGQLSEFVGDPRIVRDLLGGIEL
jgi:SNF2 family DNA or RNA helicase